MVRGLPPRSVFPRAAVAAGVLFVGMALLGGGSAAAEGLLSLAPALLLIVVLMARRYPGERLLARWAGRGPRRRRPATRASKPADRIGPPRVPRGGLLMGFSLAVRPPPAAAVG